MRNGPIHRLESETLRRKPSCVTFTVILGNGSGTDMARGVLIERVHKKGRWQRCFGLALRKHRQVRICQFVFQTADSL